MKILIDNGHGENTSGKRSPYSANGTEPALELREYKYAREIATAVVNGLVRKGYDAELLVPESYDVSLLERAHRTNVYCNSLGKKNVLLVSVHCNASGNGSKWMNAHGWEAYTTVGQTDSDKLAECLCNEAEKQFGGRPVRSDREDGDKDREKQFYILRKTLCAAVLTENFFQDNIEDVKYLLSDEGRQAVVNVHIDGIVKYISSL